MTGLVVHHHSQLWEGNVRADRYLNDPYVWATPYLWSFCHLNQRPRVKVGMTILWVSKVDALVVCDLVFVVGAVLPFRTALLRYGALDHGVAYHHFCNGIAHHSEVLRADAKTYVADMRRSYIPHPAVPIGREIDRIRRSEVNSASALAVVLRRPSSPLRIAGIQALERFVFRRARKRFRSSLAMSEPVAAQIGKAKAETSPWNGAQRWGQSWTRSGRTGW